jgi:hypothetical protein
MPDPTADPVIRLAAELVRLGLQPSAATQHARIHAPEAAGKGPTETGDLAARLYEQITADPVGAHIAVSNRQRAERYNPLRTT